MATTTFIRDALYVVHSSLPKVFAATLLTLIIPSICCLREIPEEGRVQ